MNIKRRLEQMLEGYEFIICGSIYGFDKLKNKYYRSLRNTDFFFTQDMPEYEIMIQDINFHCCH